jgi:uncharacterized membrane protein YdjX (TVP38/TMEM64 family)
MHPISFAKAHPVAVITCAAGGMAFGPAVLGWLRNVTGVGIRIPTGG